MGKNALGTSNPQMAMFLCLVTPSVEVVLHKNTQVHTWICSRRHPNPYIWKYIRVLIRCEPIYYSFVAYND